MLSFVMLDKFEVVLNVGLLLVSVEVGFVYIFGFFVNEFILENCDFGYRLIKWVVDFGYFYV